MMLRVLLLLLLLMMMVIMTIMMLIYIYITLTIDTTNEEKDALTFHGHPTQLFSTSLSLDNYIYIYIASRYGVYCYVTDNFRSCTRSLVVTNEIREDSADSYT